MPARHKILNLLHQVILYKIDTLFSQSNCLSFDFLVYTSNDLIKETILCAKYVNPWQSVVTFCFELKN